jgi:hypothetical protein
MTRRLDSFLLTEVERISELTTAIQRLYATRTKLFFPAAKEAAKAISKMFAKSLTKGVAMSLVRIGDGEGLALAASQASRHHMYIKAFAAKLSAQNGTPVSLDDAYTISVGVRHSVLNADVIGSRLKEDSTADLSGLLSHGQIGVALGILGAREFVFRQLRSGFFTGKALTSKLVYHTLIPYLPDLISAAQSVIVITGHHKLRSAFETRAGAKLRFFLSIPPDCQRHAATEALHYDQVYKSVLETLATNLRGTLVLVGGGLLGKIYCHAAKASGAVAVDLGSGFDLLAGVKTRPAHMRVDVDSLRWI